MNMHVPTVCAYPTVYHFCVHPHVFECAVCGEPTAQYVIYIANGLS